MFVRPKNLRRWAVTSCAFVSLCCIPAMAAHAQQPDNSGVNKGQVTTADSQSEHTSDRDITAKIRRSLISDHSLSMYGHNVKIITRGGAVTLKGPVHSDEEKQAIDAKAAAVVGQDKVTDQLTVKQ